MSTPSVILLMGVSGSGKTTVGTALAHALNWSFADADSFHSAENIAKMRSRQPLTDADRAPWLDEIHQHITHCLANGTPTVVTCSALKRSYREQLLRGLEANPLIRLVYLKAPRELLAARLATRESHFMPPALLDSQLATLEEPTPDEALTLDISLSLDTLVAQIRKAIG